MFGNEAFATKECFDLKPQFLKHSSKHAFTIKGFKVWPSPISAA
jgi:hypothetical protein